MSYEIEVDDVFSAAHQVRMPDGKMEPLHGHDWKVTATFAGPSLDDFGFLVDFVAAQEALRQIVARLHHTNLNDCPAMTGQMPTAEIVARVIFHALAADPALEPFLDRVRITEAPGCAATCRGDAGQVD